MLLIFPLLDSVSVPVLNGETEDGRGWEVNNPSSFSLWEKKELSVASTHTQNIEV